MNGLWVSFALNVAVWDVSAGRQVCAVDKLGFITMESLNLKPDWFFEFKSIFAAQFDLNSNLISGELQACCG